MNGAAKKLVGVLAVVATLCGTIAEAQAVEWIVNGNFEDASGTFPNGWTITANPPGTTSGLAGTTSAAVMRPDILGGRITQSNLDAGPEWQLDMYFASAMPPTVDDRSLQFVVDTSDGLINMRVNGGGSVQAFDGAVWQDLIAGGVAFSTDTTNDGDFDDAGDTQHVHRMRILGDFTTAPAYEVMLSAAGSSTFSMMSGPVSLFDAGTPAPGLGPRSLSIRSQLSLTPYVVDEISLMAEEIVTPPFSGLTNGDFEDTSGTFPMGWTINRGTPLQHAGLGGTTTATYLHKQADGGDRITQAPVGTPGPEWELDLLFAMEDPGGSADRGLNVILINDPNTGNLNLRVNGDGSVQTVTSIPSTTWFDVPNLSNAVQFSVDANDDGDFSDVGDVLNVHRLVLRGDYTTSSPEYTVHLSQANQTELALSGAANLWFTGSPSAGGSITSVSISAQNSGGDYVVDQVFLRMLGALDGDYNGDGKVDAADYVVWRKNPDAFGGAAGYGTWRANFGNPGSGAAAGQTAAVPEPTALLLAGVAAVIALAGGLARRTAPFQNVNSTPSES
jgi:hypothetical protein